MERDAILDDLKANLIKAQQRMKAMEDSKCREVEFQIGYLRLQPYRQHPLATRLSEKLSPRFYGLFEVVERVGKVAYKLELPPNGKDPSCLSGVSVESGCGKRAGFSLHFRTTFC